MKNIFTITLFSIISIATSFAQIGGKGINSFLHMPSSARTTGLGGIMIGVMDNDVALAFSNPALINDKMIGELSFSHKFHFADINSSHANYGFKLPWYNLKAHIGMQYLSYGDFTTADVYGVKQGEFSAKDVALVIGVAKEFDEKISLGINTHFINSNYESYSSYGMGFDIGAIYKVDGDNFTFSAVIRNLDFQLSSFDKREYARPDLQLAITKRLAHLPFRFSITAHNLQQWSIRYDDPNQEKETDILGEPIAENKFKQNVDNFFRHFIFAGEFLFGKKENFKVRIAYNHLRRSELSVKDFRSLAGFSGGLGIKIKGFRLDYGFAYYHLAGTSKQITISTNLSRFFKKF